MAGGAANRAAPGAGAANRAAASGAGVANRAAALGAGAVTARVVRLDEDAPEPALRQAAAALAVGGIVAYPTDTLYGLGVDPRQAPAVERLCRLKTRSAGAGIPLVAASLAQVESGAGALPPLGRRLADRFWPGPLTLVLEPAAAFPPGVCADDGSVAVRVPRGFAARRLAALCGGPITATSANLAGRPPAATAAAVAAELGVAVAVVLEQRTALTGPPSTIVDVRGRRPRLLREGAVAWERVLQSLA